MYAEFSGRAGAARRRALHYVIRVGNLLESLAFYVQTLGMKVLRHEEFTEGCKAACNGPFNTEWSKTMVGYGPEGDHFALEVVHNKGIPRYDIGNFHEGFYIESSAVFATARRHTAASSVDASTCKLVDPNGYAFFISNNSASQADPFRTLSLNVTSLDITVNYYTKMLGLQLISRQKDKAVLAYSDSQCMLEFVELNGEEFDYGDGCGRTAFSCPADELATLEESIKANQFVILTPLTKLGTPGKATVSVVILADPDGHEICFVGDEAFQQLSQFEPETEAAWRTKIAAYAEKRIG